MRTKRDSVKLKFRITFADQSEGCKPSNGRGIIESRIGISTEFLQMTRKRLDHGDRLEETGFPKKESCFSPHADPLRPIRNCP